MLRRMHHRHMLKKIHPDVLLYWNNPKFIDTLHAGPSIPKVYYERSASWLKPADQSDDMQRTLAQMNGIICNSFAARRIMELKWSIPPHTPVKVCLNAIRPESMPAHATPKTIPSKRSIRLGIAARLIAVKGIPLALHALAELKRRKMSCELWIAGWGPDVERLKQLSGQLGLEQDIRFLGLVRDMASFYSRIDCLLSPSIRESFGLVCAEAMSHGCPVIASRVDGLPEVVENKRTGFCLNPSLDVNEYVRLGGDSLNLPTLVYSPENDDLEPPRLLDPSAIADSVENLFSDSELFETMSAASISRAKAKFDFCHYTRTLIDFLKHICQ